MLNLESEILNAMKDNCPTTKGALDKNPVEGLVLAMEQEIRMVLVENPASVIEK